MSEKKKEKEIEVRFAIKEIEVVGLSINKPDPLPLTFESYTFNINIQYRLIPTEKTVLATVIVGIFDIKTQFEAGGLIVTIGYLLENYDDVVITDKENKHQIPQPVADIINSISISTSRGILYSEFKGTYLHNLIMPIVDPKLVAQQK